MYNTSIRSTSICISFIIFFQSQVFLCAKKDLSENNFLKNYFLSTELYSELQIIIFSYVSFHERLSMRLINKYANNLIINEQKSVIKHLLNYPHFLLEHAINFDDTTNHEDGLVKQLTNRFLNKNPNEIILEQLLAYNNIRGFFFRHFLKEISPMYLYCPELLERLGFETSLYQNNSILMEVIKITTEDQIIDTLVKISVLSHDQINIQQCAKDIISLLETLKHNNQSSKIRISFISSSHLCGNSTIEIQIIQSFLQELEKNNHSVIQNIHFIDISLIIRALYLQKIKKTSELITPIITDIHKILPHAHIGLSNQLLCNFFLSKEKEKNEWFKKLIFFPSYAQHIWHSKNQSRFINNIGLIKYITTHSLQYDLLHFFFLQNSRQQHYLDYEHISLLSQLIKSPHIFDAYNKTFFRYLFKYCIAKHKKLCKIRENSKEYYKKCKTDYIKLLNFMLEIADTCDVDINKYHRKNKSLLLYLTKETPCDRLIEFCFKYGVYNNKILDQAVQNIFHERLVCRSDSLYFCNRALQSLYVKNAILFDRENKQNISIILDKFKAYLFYSTQSTEYYNFTNTIIDFYTKDIGINVAFNEILETEEPQRMLDFIITQAPEKFKSNFLANILKKEHIEIHLNVNENHSLLDAIKQYRPSLLLSLPKAS